MAKKNKKKTGSKSCSKVKAYKTNSGKKVSSYARKKNKNK